MKIFREMRGLFRGQSWINDLQRKKRSCFLFLDVIESFTV